MDSSKKNIEKSIPNDLDFLRILWCDNANIIRAKALYLPKDTNFSFNQNFPFRVGISSAQQGVPVMYDGVIAETGLSPVGEIQLEADLSTLTPLPYAPTHARTMGNMMFHGKSWTHCPRGFLQRMINNLAKLKIEVKGSFENEFYLLEADNLKDNEQTFEKNHSEGSFTHLKLADKTPFASTHSMDLNQKFVEDLVNALISQDIMVEQYYAEAGPGQQEITVKYQDAMKAADNQIAFRETVRILAYQHHKTASFLPKIFDDKSGSGCHLHLSLWEDDSNILGDSEDIYGLSERGKHFIAGILKHLPALMALITPTCNSYRRIQPQSWSGAFQCWGIDNREAAIRVISDKQGVQHFELKTVDASSNPYLCMGVVLAAGYDGIKNEVELPEPMQKDPGILSEKELENYNIKQLPSDLGEAILNLEKNTVLLNALGPDLSKSYLAVKKAEYEFFKDLSLEEEVEILLEKF